MANERRVLCLLVERTGKTSRYEVHTDAVLVGSGSHCDVRLLPEDAAAEQLRVELRGEEVYAQSLATEYDCRVDGIAFRAGALRPDARVQLGQVSIQAQLTQSHAGKQRGSSDGSSPALRIVLFGAILVNLYWVVQQKPAVSLLDTTIDHPELFGPAVHECANRADGQMAPYARRLVREANLQSERTPFYPRDGVTAVLRYEEAAVCLTRDSLIEEAQAAESAAAVLRQTLSDQFHVRHVRLERFLSIKKYDAAQREVRILQDFLDQRQGPYARWLAAVQRELNTRFASAKGKV
jgi:hypothetical protein